MPGRTDNEIKNYWRTRVQKHAKQLKCDVNSKQFKDTMRYLWMPRLVERIQAAAASSSSTGATAATTTTHHHQFNNMSQANNFNQSPGQAATMMLPMNTNNDRTTTYTPENSSTAASSDSFGAQVSPVSELTTENYYSTNNTISVHNNPNHPPPPPSHDYFQVGYNSYHHPGPENQTMMRTNNTYDNNLSSSPATTDHHQLGLDQYFQAMEQNMSNYNWNLADDQGMENLWDVEDINWLLQQQLNNGI